MITVVTDLAIEIFLLILSYSVGRYWAHPWEGVAIILFVLLIWHVWQALKLITYLSEQRQTVKSVGIWAFIFNRISRYYFEKKNQQQQLQRLQKIRQDFVANVSHELRTPLTVVSGYLETLIDGEYQAQQLPDMLQPMQQQTQRMADLIEDLLLLSRLEVDSFDKDQAAQVALTPLLQNICQDARLLSGQQQHVITLSIDDDLRIMGHEKELSSAFSNLVYNAVRYSPPGSRIDIVATAGVKDVTVAVIDNGPGIEKAHLPRLTERFYRVDKGRSRQIGGTGLGLAIVKHVLKRHHAELVITSELNVGSKFCCIFNKIA